MKRIAEILRTIINLPHQTVHEQINVAYRKKRIEIYMEKLLCKPTNFTKIYSNSNGLLCLTEPKSQMYFTSHRHIKPVNCKRMEDQRA